MKALDCLSCGKALNNIDESRNHPDGGLEFTTPGHYGTTIFDPMDGSRIAINICDDCLKSAALQGRVLHYSGNTLDKFNP